jgi:hypothetical protein
MSLQLKANVTINPLGTELYIEFVDATGLYDAVDNPGGFGAPNAARNALAVFLHAIHKSVAGDTPADVTANNPTSVTAFTINMTRAVNGVLYFVLIALPYYDEEGEYADGDIVYDNVTNPVNPIIKQLNGVEWVTLGLEDLIGDDDVDQFEDYSFPIPDAIAYSQELNAQKLLAYKALKNGDCEGHEYQEALDKYQYVDGTIKAATSAFCSQSFNQAQIKIEEIFTFQDSLG